MQEYVVTFFSHYDAVQFSTAAKKAGLAVKLMPVPRKLSSSCGTGAVFTAQEAQMGALLGEGVDKVFCHRGEAYELSYDSGSGS